MKVSKIVVLSAGVLGLTLAGLYSWAPPSDPPRVASATAHPPPEPPAPGPLLRHVASKGTQATPLHPRPVSPPPAETPPQAQSPALSVATNSLSDIEAALGVARQDVDFLRRIEALKFLGEHALPQHLERLQQIQMEAPSPEVRRAAEEAVHNTMARFAGQPWPGIPTGVNPLDYMRDAPAPGPP